VSEQLQNFGNDQVQDSSRDREQVSDLAQSSLASSNVFRKRQTFPLRKRRSSSSRDHIKTKEHV